MTISPNFMIDLYRASPGAKIVLKCKRIALKKN